MAEIVHMNYQSLSILNRFGIELGFGDKTIEKVCQEKSVNVDFFLEIINAFIDKDYSPKRHLQSFSVALITNYLLKTHIYYYEVKVPEIEQLINQMIDNCYTQKDNIVLLKKFFNDYKTELENHMEREEEVVYPYSVSIEEAYNGKLSEEKTKQLFETYSIDVFKTEHDDIEEKLYDLKNILIKYLPQPNDVELCNKLIQELFILEKDLNDHSIIEDKVLVPKITAMEKEIKDRFAK